jgi:hypothetical protein
MMSEMFRRAAIAVGVGVAVLATGSEAGAQYRQTYRPRVVQYPATPTYITPTQYFTPVIPEPYYTQVVPAYRPVVVVQPAPKVIVVQQVRPAPVPTYPTWGWRFNPYSGSWGWGFGY